MTEKNAVSSSVIELYIGTFNRAPAQSGLDYWVDAISVDGWTIEDVAESFFEQTETTEKYPESMPTATYIDTVFNNVLGRSPENEGLTYWTTALDTGAISRNNFILAVINGAKIGGTGTDNSLLQSKHDVGQYFAVDLGLEDVSLAKRIMEDVTDTLESRDRAKSTLDLFSAAGANLNYVELDDTDNTVLLGDTDDWIYALGGNDTIQAVDGKKWIHAGAGNDYIYGSENDSTFHGGTGSDTMYGNAGDDVIYGYEGNDLIHGDDDDDLLYGDADDDYLYGDAGDDTLYGGDGDDVINGGDGADTLYGNAGDDIINGGEGVSIMDGGAGNDILYGGSSNDTMYCGEDNDTAYGRDGDDRIDGMSGNDTLYGGSGVDFLFGNSGSDMIFGGSGDDILLGEYDNDSLQGDAGSDTLTGGTGSDQFIFQIGDSNLLGYDSIIDFTLEDTLVLVEKGDVVVNEMVIDVTAASTLGDAADFCAAADGSVNAQVSWFVFEDDTYVVQDMSASETFINDSDLIIKLQGILDLDDVLSDVVAL